MKSAKNLAIVILAAGLSTRMQSPTSKVLHTLSGKTILERTLLILKLLNPGQIIIVANKKNFKKIQKLTKNKYVYVLQPKQKGTADALKIALKWVNKNIADILVANGDDNIFYKTETIKKVYEYHLKSKSDICFISIKTKNPKGFGRVIQKNDTVKIVEEKDASKSEKKIKEINDGVYFFKKTWLFKNINKLKPSPKTGEVYITDLIRRTPKAKPYKLSDQNQYFSISTQNDLKKAQVHFDKRIHIMGIRGAGASAVAQIAKSRGFIVDGCDLKNKSSYDVNLKNISVEAGHDKSHVANISKLIISPAVLRYSPANPEILEAKKQKIEISTWQKFQGEILQKGKFVITVTGAYGKSTTTAMIADVLKSAGLDPTCEIGAKVLAWGKNYQVGNSKYYVCEADEYMDNFLNYKSDIAVILNMGWDHPDYFKNISDLEKSYKKFIKNIKPGGLLIVANDPRLNKITHQITENFKVMKLEDFSPKITIIGEFRKINANAALTVAKALDIDIQKAKQLIANFKGIGRRLEFKGKINGSFVFDDYAVQAYTIRVTANALAKKFKNKKIALVLEPHTFSRVKVFFKDFVKNLKEVNVEKIYVTSVYSAREKARGENLSQKLAGQIGDKAQYSGSLQNTALVVKKHIKNYEIICSMGAGDIYKLYDLMKNSIKDSP